VTASQATDKKEVIPGAVSFQTKEKPTYNKQKMLELLSIFYKF